MESTKTLHCPWCGVVIPREEILEKHKCPRCGWVFNLKWDCEFDSVCGPIGDSGECGPRVDHKEFCAACQVDQLREEDTIECIKDLQREVDIMRAAYGACRKCVSGLKPDSSTIKVKSPILAEASELIHGDRAKDYGDAKESFAHIAALWSAYLKATISPQDVAMMMSLLKMSRAKHSGFTHRDSFVDMAGYVALASDIGE